MARTGGRPRGSSCKVQWTLPSDVIRVIRRESARLDVTEGKLVAAIIRERLAAPIEKGAKNSTFSPRRVQLSGPIGNGSQPPT